MKAADGKIAERWKDAYADAVKGLDSDTKWLDSTVAGLIEELSAAEERERVLREALEKYGSHDDGCPATTPAMFRDDDRSYDCKCGYASALATPAPQQPAKRYRLNSGPCAAMVVDCDCRICSPELEDRPAPCQCALCLATPAPEPSEQNGGQ